MLRKLTSWMSSDQTELVRQVVTFVVVGGIGALINAGVYVVLIFCGIHYVAASIGAWLISVPVGNLLNSRLTFRSKVSAARSLPKVAAIYLAQQGLALLIISLLVEWAKFDPILAYAVAVPPAVAFSYLAMRYFAFR